MCMYLDVSVCVCVLSVNVWVLGVNVGESMCMSVYVRKSACERKQMIKQTGQMFIIKVPPADPTHSSLSGSLI